MRRGFMPCCRMAAREYSKSWGSWRTALGERGLYGLLMLLSYLGPEKGFFLCGRRVGSVFDSSCELLGSHAPFFLDWGAMYLHVF